jgi:hypothetical protein
MGTMSLSQLQYETEHRMGFDECIRRSPEPSVIRALQRQRGEEPCFSTDKRHTCAGQCEWRKECHKSRAVWLC